MTHVAESNVVHAPSMEHVAGDECPHCVSGPQSYRMLYDTYKFDVDMAIAMVQDGREVFELPEEDVRHSLDWSEIHEQHLAHVDMRYPGIIAHYWYEEADGTILHGHVLIDGHHRAAKAHADGLPFQVVVLSEEESRRITQRSPGSIHTRIDL